MLRKRYGRGEHMLEGGPGHLNRMGMSGNDVQSYHNGRPAREQELTHDPDDVSEGAPLITVGKQR